MKKRKDEKKFYVHPCPRIEAFSKADNEPHDAYARERVYFCTDTLFPVLHSISFSLIDISLWYLRPCPSTLCIRVLASLLPLRPLLLGYVLLLRHQQRLAITFLKMLKRWVSCKEIRLLFLWEVFIRLFFFLQQMLLYWNILTVIIIWLCIKF